MLGIGTIPSVRRVTVVDHAWLLAWCALRWVIPCILIGLTGCSLWRKPIAEPTELPSTQMSPDSVAIEITFVRVPALHLAASESLWQHVDEQTVDVDTQLRLASNGFRIGTLGTQLPDDLRELLDEQEDDTALDAAVSSEIDLLTKNRRVQARAGRRTEIVASDLRDEIVVLYREPESDRVKGETFHEAQCIIAVKSFPQGDGSTKLRIVPEVHHGPVQNQFVPSQGTLRMLPGKKRKVYQHLETTMGLNPGETLVLSCTSEMTGVGNAFFVEADQGDKQQKLLLIRLSQTQRNDLFDD